MNSETLTSDPIVWTNSRVIEWVQNIDLEVTLLLDLYIFSPKYFVCLQERERERDRERDLTTHNETKYFIHAVSFVLIVLGFLFIMNQSMHTNIRSICCSGLPLVK